MLDLEEFATQLDVSYAERAKLDLSIWRAGQDLIGRERSLRPETGWPGKNDEARASAKEAALAGDEHYQNTIVNRDAAQAKLGELLAFIAGVEAQRRAAEWRIRERLVEALTRGGVAQQGRGDRMEGTFDDTLQREVDETTEAHGTSSFDEVEMPF